MDAASTNTDWMNVCSYGLTTKLMTAGEQFAVDINFLRMTVWSLQSIKQKGQILLKNDEGVVRPISYRMGWLTVLIQIHILFTSVNHKKSCFFFHHHNPLDMKSPLTSSQAGVHTSDMVVFVVLFEYIKLQVGLRESWKSTDISKIIVTNTDIHFSSPDHRCIEIPGAA